MSLFCKEITIHPIKELEDAPTCLTSWETLLHGMFLRMESSTNEEFIVKEWRYQLPVGRDCAGVRWNSDALCSL